ALLLEHPCDGASFTHVPAILAEGVTDLADRAVAVIGGDFDEDGNAARAVAFEGDLFVTHAWQFAGAALDGFLDVVARHIFSLSGSDRGSQAGILIRVTAALRSHGDFLDKTGEDLAALSIKRALLVLNCGPFRVAGHAKPLLSVNSER